MATDPLFDFEELLQPFDGESPAGQDIRADYSPNSPYFEIKDSQAAARTSERRRRESFGESMDTQFSLDDWNPILQSARDILKNSSKDLEIAAWHIEAMLRTDGFAGVRDGFQLLRQLIERFWDDVHPRPDEDGIETTVTSITSLNGEDGPGTLIWPISNIPLFQNKAIGGWQIRQAQSLDGAEPDVIEERAAEGYITPEMLRGALRETSTDFFRNTLADIDAAIEAVEQCDELLYERCCTVEGGQDVAPGIRNIVEALKEAASALRSVTVDLNLDEAPAQETDGEVGNGEGEGGELATATAAPGQAMTATGGTPLLANTAGIVQTREQAFRAIQELADHFKKTEPHSPIPYLLDQAVRWGRLPLPQLLRELVFDQNLKDDLFRVMGMSNPNDTDDM